MGFAVQPSPKTSLDKYVAKLKDIQENIDDIESGIKMLSGNPEGKITNKLVLGREVPDTYDGFIQNAVGLAKYIGKNQEGEKTPEEFKDLNPDEKIYSEQRKESFQRSLQKTLNFLEETQKSTWLMKNLASIRQGLENITQSAKIAIPMIKQALASN